MASPSKHLSDLVIDTDAPVLIQGETGTGKELVARALAASTQRRREPFVKINCAALPGDLLESELFGFERGAFTGALQRKPGKFEIADGGTIFLDEVGEIPLHLQSKLLQVLQDGHFSRLGGVGEVHPIVRVVAATNRDLNQAVIDGTFREDLLFRLNVIPMRVSPLRERRHDIPSLTDLFLKRSSVAYHRRYVATSPGMMDVLLRYDWPGNIRELENVVKRIVVLGTEESTITALSRMVAAQVRTTVPDAPVKAPITVDPGTCSLKCVSRRAIEEVEMTMITRMLQQTGGDRKQAARNLGISYKALLYKAKAYGIGAHRGAARTR